MTCPPGISVITSAMDSYALLDSGGGRKLEQFGPVIVDRGEPKAWWRPNLHPRTWSAAHARHEDGRGWSIPGNTRRSWPMTYGGISLEARISETSKHLGVFPEQAAHWDWIRQHAPSRGGSLSMLNLFGYTGAATLTAAKAGLRVTHVDASKNAVTWARHNQSRSGLADASVRWIVDDALRFVKREARRGNSYDALVLDPPSFGRGPSGQMWKAERDMADLLEACRVVLSPNPIFVIMTLYAIEASAIMISNLLNDMMRGISGGVEMGELAVRQQHGERILPLAIFGRWSPK